MTSNGHLVRYLFVGPLDAVSHKLLLVGDIQQHANARLWGLRLLCFLLSGCCRACHERDTAGV